MKKLLAFCLLLVCGAVAAGPLEYPTGPVIVTVKGNISRTNEGETAVFDRAMLEQLGMQSLVTSNPWSKGRVEYEGPLVRALLEAVGAEGDTAEVTALNDYMVSVPVSDFYDYDIVLAMKADGQYLRVREKGPLFIVYPFDDMPELDNEVSYRRSAWQIKSIRIN